METKKRSIGYDDGVSDLSESSYPKKVKIYSVILIMTLLISAVLLSVVLTLPLEVPERSYISYTTHAPILIDGDAGFLGLNATTGISRGSGTSVDPYIIEGWGVDASTANGIQIQNSHLFFTIRNCYAHDGGGSYRGIYLFTCMNGTVMGNNCSNNFDNILLSVSSKISVYNNNCSYSTSGYSMVLHKSGNNSVHNNNCNDSDIGILVATSSNNNSVYNNNCSLNERGIVLDNSAIKNRVSNNNCSFNDRGIWLWSSSENRISDNNCSSNNYDGIWLHTSSNCTISNNTCKSNAQYGINLTSSSNKNTLINNTCSSNSLAGIVLESSYNNTMSNNICSNNPDGIFLGSLSNDNTIRNNTCSNNQYGITVFSSSSKNTLSNNTCNSNSLHGIYLDSSSDDVLSNNTCSNNQYGITVYSSSNRNVLNDNTCDLNTNYGIYLDLSSNDNTIVRNQLRNNTLHGAYLGTGSNNRIWNNTFIGNNGAGSTRDTAHLQAHDGGTNNHWNTSDSPHGYGNYWSDWTTPDADFDGIVDKTYNLTAGVGPMDYYPLTTPAPPIPEFSELIVPILGLVLIALISGRTRKRP